VYFHKMNNRSNLQIIFNECDFRGIFISWNESCCDICNGNKLSTHPAHKGYFNSLSKTIDNTMEELSEEGSSLVYFGFDIITRNVMKNVGYTIESIFKKNGYDVTWDETMKTKIGVVITEIDLPVGFRNEWDRDNEAYVEYESNKKDEIHIRKIKKDSRKIDTFIDSERSDSDDQYTSSEYGYDEDFSCIPDNEETVEDFLTDIRKDIYNSSPTNSLGSKYLKQDDLHSLSSSGSNQDDLHFLSSSGSEQNFNKKDYESKPDIVKTEHEEEPPEKTTEDHIEEERGDCDDTVCPECCDCVNCEEERDDTVCPEGCDCVNCEEERGDCDDTVCPEGCDCVNCEEERGDCDDTVCPEGCDCVNCEEERGDCDDTVCPEGCDCVNCEEERGE
jgi:hypothetical protein